jgi:hypothetical protein
VTSPQRVLDVIAGMQVPVGSNPKRLRVGSVDPVYRSGSYPGVLPRVVFDGESRASCKRYMVVGSYRPEPGDRVVLAPVGTTYVILGAVGGTRAYPVELGEDAWHDVSFQNGWSNRGGGWAPFRYRKLAGDLLMLAGAVSVGTATGGTVVCSLPIGYRPVSIQSVVLAGLTSSGYVPKFEVHTSGDVQFWDGVSGYVQFSAAVPLGY